MAIPEGQKGHCSLCDQRLGFPAWVAVDVKPEKPKPPEEPPPAIELPEGWTWKRFGYNGWGAQSSESKACCYTSRDHGNLLACVGKVPFFVRVAVGNATGASPL